MKSLVAILFLLSANAFAQPDNMDCRDATVVIYQPAARWSEFADFRDAHLEYLAKSMATDVILYAGPMFNGDDLDGGLNIYSETDLDKVKTLIQNDAIVANGVVTPVIKPWMMCTKKSEGGVQ